MTKLFISSFFSLFVSAGVHAFGESASGSTSLRKLQNNDLTGTSRRSLLKRVLSTTAAALLSLPSASSASSSSSFSSRLLDDTGAAAQDDSRPTLSSDVYFGVGCFWHIQHEFVEAERLVLGRSDTELTSRAGYAGGKKAGEDGLVCYHNRERIADYGKLGFGEVVGMTLPNEKIGEFAKMYFSLFDDETKERVDPQDRGGEYRSMLGLPGGSQHVEYAAVEEAATQRGFRLELGKGNDGDTLGKNQLIWVYDTLKFPFYQAEVYHQFHDDFQSAPYGKKYNELVELALEDGRVQITGCPDRI